MNGGYDSLRLRDQLCFPLYLCAKEIVRRYQPLLDNLNLTYTQYVVMMYLWEMGSGSAKDLSRALLLDPSTLTPVFKRLEQKGYLTRERDPEDERALLIRLTDAGAKLKDAALDIPARMGNRMGLSGDEEAQLCALIEKVLANIEKEE